MVVVGRGPTAREWNDRSLFGGAIALRQDPPEKGGKLVKVAFATVHKRTPFSGDLGGGAAPPKSLRRQGPRGWGPTPLVPSGRSSRVHDCRSPGAGMSSRLPGDYWVHRSKTYVRVCYAPVILCVYVNARVVSCSKCSYMSNIVR